MRQSQSERAAVVAGRHQSGNMRRPEGWETEEGWCHTFSPSAKGRWMKWEESVKRFCCNLSQRRAELKVVGKMLYHPSEPFWLPTKVRIIGGTADLFTERMAPQSCILIPCTSNDSLKLNLKKLSIPFTNWATKQSFKAQTFELCVSGVLDLVTSNWAVFNQNRRFFCFVFHFHIWMYEQRI